MRLIFQTLTFLCGLEKVSKRTASKQSKFVVDFFFWQLGIDLV